VQHETRNEIENIKKGMENKINKENMEKALNQHTEMLADETYASKIKNEVDQHLIERHGLSNFTCEYENR